MEIARRQLHVAEQVAEIVQVAGNEVLHAVHAFPAAAHREQARFQQRATAT